MQKRWKYAWYIVCLRFILCSLLQVVKLLISFLCSQFGIFYGLIQPWSRPFRESLAPLYKSVDSGLKVLFAILHLSRLELSF